MDNAPPLAVGLENTQGFAVYVPVLMSTVTRRGRTASKCDTLGVSGMTRAPSTLPRMVMGVSRDTCNDGLRCLRTQQYLKRYNSPMPVSPKEKHLHWIGSAKKDLIALPADVVDDFAYALGAVQKGCHTCAG